MRNTPPQNLKQYSKHRKNSQPNLLLLKPPSCLLHPESLQKVQHLWHSFQDPFPTQNPVKHSGSLNLKPSKTPCKFPTTESVVPRRRYCKSSDSKELLPSWSLRDAGLLLTHGFNNPREDCASSAGAESYNCRYISLLNSSSRRDEPAPAPHPTLASIESYRHGLQHRHCDVYVTSLAISAAAAVSQCLNPKICKPRTFKLEVLSLLPMFFQSSEALRPDGVRTRRALPQKARPSQGRCASR